ncbi:MAG: FMN-binding glutamate synthase family protein [Rhodopirellula sp.]|nr:FMN-binding glutamate synthase family protein [Rhodopirellula sp.]
MLNAAYAIGAVLVLLAIFDVVQTKHAILRNFPILGHFRYLLEMIGPELRQYIVTSNNEERPFSRDERSWVYASAKKQNNYVGFGTDNDLEQEPNHLIIKHAAFPLLDIRQGHPNYDPQFRIPCAKVLGEARNRKRAFRPASVVNVSGMSYGSLSGPAVEAINRGCKIAGCLHNTGEGGISEFHQQGGELIWQIGTGYFGCRDELGNFDLQRFKDCIAKNPVRAIEIKLSQGAKPGLGGLLPAAKITPQIAKIRGIPMGKDCASPSAHSSFHDADSLLDFVEMLADQSGLPVGIKSAVGESQFWNDLARLMDTTGRGVDFITVDGGEGGTGAAPLVFSDHVSLPFKIGFTRVYREFFERGLQSQIVFVGSGKLGFPASAILAYSLGCDMVHVARESMLSIGCIQAQRCHTGHCPTGVATQNRWLMRGLDPTHKGARLANYIVTLRKEILQLSRACGVAHPSLVTADQCEITDERFGSVTVRELFKIADSLEYGLPSDEQRATMLELPPPPTS